MWEPWFAIIAEGLACPREDDSATEGKTFESRLTGAKAEMMERFKANLCPKENLLNFEFKGFLGGGGAGNVYLVKRRREGDPTRCEKIRTYALKVIEKDTEDRDSNLRYVMEKKLTRAVQFKFIIQLHSVFQGPGNFFFVMDAAPYGSLWSQIAKIKLTEPVLKWYAAQMILAVQYLHACRIVHRDLKPHNMLIFKDGFLKIADFGVAKIVETRTHTSCGTLQFMAPEVVQQIPYGTWVDWWSVGVSIFSVFYKKYPYPSLESHGLTSFEKVTFPVGVDLKSPFCDFIRRLLSPKCTERLGCSMDGAQELMEHRWFADISFRDVYTKKLNLKPSLIRIKPLALDGLYKYDIMRLKKLYFRPRPEMEWFDSFCTE